MKRELKGGWAFELPHGGSQSFIRTVNLAVLPLDLDEGGTGLLQRIYSS